MKRLFPITRFKSRQALGMNLYPTLNGRFKRRIDRDPLDGVQIDFMFHAGGAKACHPTRENLVGRNPSTNVVRNQHGNTDGLCNSFNSSRLVHHRTEDVVRIDLVRTQRSRHDVAHTKPDAAGPAVGHLSHAIHHLQRGETCKLDVVLSRIGDVPTSKDAIAHVP